MKECEKKRLVDKMWALWKCKFLEPHKVFQSQIQASEGAGQFGSAKASSAAANPSKSPIGITPNILDKMEDCMDNMNNAVKN